jgi:hypothetical protein
MNILPPKNGHQNSLAVVAGQKLPIQARREADSGAIHTIVLEEGTGLRPARRLVVLVPAVDVDEVELARRIWEIAAPPGLAVLYLGLCASTAEEPAMQRRLITLASLTRDVRLPLETRIEFGRDWLRRIKPIHRPGDVIICHAEQHTGLGHRPLSRALRSLGGPVWTLAGFYPSHDTTPHGLLSEVIFWGVSVAILVAFFWLQVRIVRLHDDWAHNLLLYLSVLAEGGLLWLWQQLST